MAFNYVFKSLNYSFYKDGSKAYIGRSAKDSHRCSSSREGSPAGYSRLSLDCIKGCARNYRCKYGKFKLLLGNNCHKFANRLSAVLCTTGTTCPSWCLGSCNDAVESYQKHFAVLNVVSLPTLKDSKSIQNIGVRLLFFFEFISDPPERSEQVKIRGTT